MGPTQELAEVLAGHQPWPAAVLPDQAVPPAVALEGLRTSVGVLLEAAEPAAAAR